MPRASTGRTRILVALAGLLAACGSVAPPSEGGDAAAPAAVGESAAAASTPLTVSPHLVAAYTGSGIVFTASGGSGTGYTFSMLSSPSGGSTNTGGIYVSGSVVSVTDVLQVSDSAGNLARARINVYRAPSSGPKVSPWAVLLAPHEKMGFVVMSGTGIAPFTWSWSAHYNPTSTISNTSGPSTTYTAGAYSDPSDTLKLTDGAGAVAYPGCQMIPAILWVSPSSVTVPPRGGASFSAVGGTGLGYQWTVSPNRSGGSVSATGGYLAGSTPGVQDVVQVMDSLGVLGVARVAVGPGVSIAAASSVPPRGSWTFVASGGSGAAFTWSMAANRSGGSISGAGLYTAGATAGVIDQVRVVDSLGNSATATITVGAGVSVSPASTTAPPGGHLTFTAQGGSGIGYAWTLTANRSGGSIGAGAYTAGSTGGVIDEIRVTDSLGNTATATVTVGAGVYIQSAGPVPPRGSLTFTAQGGSGTGYAWSLVAGPSGGTISSAGVYTAGPTGSVTDVVRVTDSLGGTATTSVVVGPGVSAAPDHAEVVVGGTVTFAASGGSGSGYLWSLRTNASGGAMNGATGAYTAGATGQVTDTLQVQDSLGNTANATVSVGLALSISPAAPRVPPRGTQQFTAAGGTGPYAWSLETNDSGGAVVAGTGLYTAGTVAGSIDTVRATDAAGNVARATVTVTDAISVSPDVLTVVTGGVQQFTATGGGGTYTWSLDVNGSGATINATSGTYQAGSSGNQRDMVRASDALGNTATAIVNVVSRPPKGGCSAGGPAGWLAVAAVAAGLSMRRRAG